MELKDKTTEELNEMGFNSYKNIDRARQIMDQNRNAIHCINEELRLRSEGAEADEKKEVETP